MMQGIFFHWAILQFGPDGPFGDKGQESALIEMFPWTVGTF